MWGGRAEIIRLQWVRGALKTKAHAVSKVGELSTECGRVTCGASTGFFDGDTDGKRLPVEEGHRNRELHATAGQEVEKRSPVPDTELHVGSCPVPMRKGVWCISRASQEGQARGKEDKALHESHLQAVVVS